MNLDAYLIGLAATFVMTVITGSAGGALAGKTMKYAILMSVFWPLAAIISLFVIIAGELIEEDDSDRY